MKSEHESARSPLPKHSTSDVSERIVGYSEVAAQKSACRFLGSTSGLLTNRPCGNERYGDVSSTMSGLMRGLR